MSYWDDANACLSDLVAKGSMALSETQRQHALRKLCKTPSVVCLM